MKSIIRIVRTYKVNQYLANYVQYFTCIRLQKIYESPAYLKLNYYFQQTSLLYTHCAALVSSLSPLVRKRKVQYLKVNHNK